MKFTVTLKDPDGFSESVKDAVDESVDELDGLDDEEKDALREVRSEKTWEKLEQFVEYQEYVTIEFDTDAGTATVVKRK